MRKDDAYYVEKTVDQINKIIEYSKGTTIDDLKVNRLILDSIVYRIVQMSDYIEKISPTFKVSHPDINWYDIKGLKNYIMNDYDNVDIEFIYTSITKFIPELKEQLLK